MLFIILVRKYIIGDVNIEDIIIGMSVTEYIIGEESSEQGIYVDVLINILSRMLVIEEGVRDVGIFDDLLKRKLGRILVFK